MGNLKEVTRLNNWKPEQLREVGEIPKTKDDSFVAIKDEDNDDMSMSFESPDIATGDPKDRKISKGSMVTKEGETDGNGEIVRKSAAISKEKLQLGEAQRSNMT